MNRDSGTVTAIPRCLQRFVRRMVNGLIMAADVWDCAWCGPKPNEQQNSYPCHACNGKGYRRECGCRREQNRNGCNAGQESKCETNCHDRTGIPLLIFWGDACEKAVSNGGRNTHSEKRNDEPSATNIGGLGSDDKSCGHLKTSVCPHELTMIVSVIVGCFHGGANPPND